MFWGPMGSGPKVLGLRCLAPRWGTKSINTKKYFGLYGPPKTLNPKPRAEASLGGLDPHG